MIGRLLLGTVLALGGIFLVQQVAMAPLWSNYYSDYPVYCDESKYIPFLIGDFIKTHHPGITNEDYIEIILSIIKSGKKYNVDPRLIAALIAAESGFRKTAVSRKGARGLTQLMPDKCRDFDWRDINGNISRGTEYLRRMMDRFKSISLALAAYNAGPTRIARGGTWPRETRYYVKKVITYYEKLLGARNSLVAQAAN